MRPRLRASRRLRSELVTVTEALVQPATVKTVLRRKRRA